MPTKRRPVRMHAMAVVPLPMNGSRTTPPGGTFTCSIVQLITRTGFCVGCPTRSAFVALMLEALGPAVAFATLVYNVLLKQVFDGWAEKSGLIKSSK